MQEQIYPWKEPRFYYIKVKNIRKISPKFAETKHQRLIFKLGDKTSQTSFSIAGRRTPNDDDLKRFQQEAHMFCYEAEQILVVKFGEDGKKANFLGYSNVLLTPLIKMPHTRHQLTINMVFQHKDKSIDKDISAVLQIELHFLLNFKAHLQVEPISANLSRNTASLGQMRPYIRFRINGQQSQSEVIESGGIHPKWQGYFNLKNVDSFLESKHSTYKGPFVFDLDSVGNELEVVMYSLGMFGGHPDLIGSTCIKLQNFGFFKYPNKTVLFQEKEAISLFYGADFQLAGKLALKSRLVFSVQSAKCTQGEQ